MFTKRICLKTGHARKALDKMICFPCMAKATPLRVWGWRKSTRLMNSGRTISTDGHDNHQMRLGPKKIHSLMNGGHDSHSLMRKGQKKLKAELIKALLNAKKTLLDFANFQIISYLKLKIVMQLHVKERHECCIHKTEIFVL